MIRIIVAALAIACLLIISAQSSLATPADPVEQGVRCPVCGMFVAQYEQWHAQIIIEGRDPLVFDGVKDMMAYYFNPAGYGEPVDMEMAEVWVRNYYTLDYIEARAAYYVAGSDVMGPMGEELIPFSSLGEAENFNTDHHGSEILRFAEIDARRIMEMKKKHMIQMKKMKPMKKQN
jgi:nitrous oxide reductase accessory protein NosL